MHARALSQIQAPVAGEGFTSRRHAFPEPRPIRCYAFSLDGMRYNVFLSIPIRMEGSLPRIAESDLAGVIRDGRPIPAQVFIRAYEHFLCLMRAEGGHSIQIFNSLAGR